MRADLLEILCAISLLLAATPRPAMADTPCPPPAGPQVNPSTLVGDAQQATSGIRCEGHTSLAGGDCLVAGLHVDRGCAQLPPGQGAEVAAAIRDVRGANGVGCVRSMNPGLAAALESTMSRNPPVDYCCGQCEGRPDTVADASQCARTVRPDGAHPAAVVFNAAVFGTGVCGGLRYDQPVRGALLHELTHASGVPGVDEHGPAVVADPEALHPEQLTAQGIPLRHQTPVARLDQRNFVPDPVYGCQNSCYGKAQYRTSMECAACASAVADPQFAASQTARGGDNADSEHLLDRILNLEGRLASGEHSSVPQRCQDLWRRTGDPGRRHFGAATAARIIRDQGRTLEACNDLLAGRHPSFRQSLAEFVAPCADSARAVAQACSQFAAPEASGCQPSSDALAPFHTAETVHTCRYLLKSYQDTILGNMRALRSGPLAANSFRGLSCSDYFQPQPICAQLVDNTVPEYTQSACQNTLPVAPPSQ